MKDINQSTKAIQKINSIVALLVKNLTDNCKIDAILCYGSYAEGTQDDQSDIDLYVICSDKIPTAELRNEIYLKNQASSIVLDKNHENWETSWIPVNDEMFLNKKIVEIGYNRSFWIQDVIKHVMDGKTSLETFQYRPYTFLALLENAVCLYENNSYHTKLLAELRPFSSKLKAAIVAENNSIFIESLEELKDYNQRNVGILAFQFMMSRAFDAAVQILFAINEVYYPASKREEQHLLNLPKHPPVLAEFLNEQLPVFYTKQKEIIHSLEEIKSFIDNYSS